MRVQTPALICFCVIRELIAGPDRSGENAFPAPSVGLLFREANSGQILIPHLKKSRKLCGHIQWQRQ